MQHSLPFLSKSRRIRFALVAGFIAALTGSLFALSFNTKGVTALTKYEVAAQIASPPTPNSALKKGILNRVANTTVTAQTCAPATDFSLPVIDDNPNDKLTWGAPFNYFGHYYADLGGH